MKMLLSVLCLSTILVAQQKAEFEVASVKPADPNAQGTRFQVLPGGGMAITNATLRQVIVQAFNIREFQLTGGPSWVSSERFDIRATANEKFESAADLSPAEFVSARERITERLRNLLVERFQLVVRKEMKEQPAYALLVTQKGPRMKTVDGTNINMAQRGSSVRSGADGQMTWTATTIDVELMTRTLGGLLGRTVVDRTGLAGAYDFSMEWVQDLNPAQAEGATIFTAIQEQLGLRLESTKAPVEVYTIERVERPSEN